MARPADLAVAADVLTTGRLTEIRDQWSRPCGACDGGLPMMCTHPKEDPRSVIPALVNEILTLRAFLAERAAEIAARTGWSVVEATAAIEDVAGLIADRERLQAELDRTTADLAVAAEVARERGQEVERLRKVAEAVEALHRPIRVYDECDHDDCQAEQIEVCDYMACADSVIGWGCESCCYDEDYPIEDCPHGADHRGVSKDDSCPTHAAVRAWREGPC